MSHLASAPPSASIELRAVAVKQIQANGTPVRQALFAYFAISQSVGALWITVIGFLITAAGFHVAFWVMAASFVLAGLVIAVFCRDARRPATP